MPKGVHHIVREFLDGLDIRLVRYIVEDEKQVHQIAACSQVL